MGQDQGRRRAFRRTIPAQFRFIRRAAGSEGTLIRVNMLAMGFHHPSLRCKPVASWPPGNGRRSTLPKTVDGSPYMNTATSTAYNYKVVRQFAIMTVVWGIVGMLVGVLIAAQLAWPALNFDLPWTSFGRLRPLHTNAVIFAFGGCALFATSLHVVQRTCHTKLFGGALIPFVFWGWQLVIVAAAITLPLGITQGKEYAELEWPIDLLITAVWVAYAVVFFGTIAKRRVKHIYVANWFYDAYLIAIALLHLVNHISIPVV